MEDALLILNLRCSKYKIFRFYSPDKFENIKEHTGPRTVKNTKQYYILRKIMKNINCFECVEPYFKPNKMYVYILPAGICDNKDTTQASIQSYLNTVIHETLEKNYIISDKVVSDTLIQIWYIKEGMRDGFEILYEYDRKECTITYIKY